MLVDVHTLATDNKLITPIKITAVLIRYLYYCEELWQNYEKSEQNPSYMQLTKFIGEW